MAWLGQPLLIDELLFKTQHGIVDQSLHSRLGAEPTNGDWVRARVVRRRGGPWSLSQRLARLVGCDLRELAAHIESPLFMAHVRAAIGSPVQETNCHPFRDGRWLFVHNGFIADFHRLRRDLMLAVDPARFADIHGSTDTEVVFYLALAFGLEDDPIEALERTVGFIETTAREHAVSAPVQASFGVADGDSLWAVRYATEGVPRSLFASTDVATIRQLHPDNPRLQRLSSDDRLIVSSRSRTSPASGRRSSPRRR
jgi:glutamine amidotransferase